MINQEQRKKDFLLVEGILGGEERALSEFYRFFAPRVLNYIKGRIENRADGEEVLQDTLLATIEALRDYSGRSNLTTFVYAIAAHKVVDYYRKKKIKQVLFSRLPELGELVGTLLGPEEEFDEEILREKIELTLARLKPSYGVVLVLKYVDGLSVMEIAGRLLQSVKAIESRLFRAKKAFVKIYGG